MKKSFKRQLGKTLLSALVVAVFGFILLNLTFLFDALYQGVIRGIINLFVPLGPETGIAWLPPVLHLSFVLVIGIISLLVFKSKIKTLYKAVYLAVPIAVVLVTIGMFLYQFPGLNYLVGALFCIGILYYFYRTKQPWLYYYVVILIGLTLAIFSFFGGEI